MHKIPEIFKASDTVFHYTKLNTALEHILYNRQLLFSPRRNAYDPIEQMKPIITQGGIFSPNTSIEDIMGEKHDITKELRSFVTNKLNTCKQLCFCMNEQDMVQNLAYQNYIHAEYYGFLKPRMWDQYADKYHGVCLAFSLPELQKSKELLHNKVEYINYDRLKYNNMRIDINKLLKLGDEVYAKDYKERFEKLLFKKHIDYKGENEYRFCTFTDESNYLLDVSQSLKGIIISGNFTSNFAQDALLNYAQEYDLDLMKINWSADGVAFTTKEEIVSMQKWIKENSNIVSEQE